MTHLHLTFKHRMHVAYESQGQNRVKVQISCYSLCHILAILPSTRYLVINPDLVAIKTA